MANQQELIFRREALHAIGGFPNFPLAWWSDVAFTIACGTRRGIWTIVDSNIYFRKSGINISSNRDPEKYQLKLVSMVDFFVWLIFYINNNDCRSFLEREVLKKLCREHFFERLMRRNAWIPVGDINRITEFAQLQFGMKRMNVLARLGSCDLSYLIRRGTRGIRTLVLRGEDEKH